MYEVYHEGRSLLVYISSGSRVGQLPLVPRYPRYPVSDVGLIEPSGFE